MNTILLFAGIAEKARQRQLRMEAGGWTVGELRDRLAADYPQLAHDLEHALFAVNEEMAAAGEVIRPGDTIAVMPPVSGG